jgi:hypothetical protein
MTPNSALPVLPARRTMAARTLMVHVLWHLLVELTSMGAISPTSTQRVSRRVHKLAQEMRSAWPLRLLVAKATVLAISRAQRTVVL